MDALVHSIETFGTVDGPGIRFVVFLKGCPLRCLYCHNPDTWKNDGAQKISAEKLFEEFLKNKEFYSNGGITVTGGEPLLQMDFLIEFFTLAKKEGVHTCIDTSGAVFQKNNIEFMQKMDALISLTDLVMLDIKLIDSQKHKALTGAGNENILEFAEYLNQKGISIQIRHVVIEGYTDSCEDLKNLGRFIGRLKSVHSLDVIPYHTMGVEKYKELGITYPLADLKPLSLKAAQNAKMEILKGIKESRTSSF